MENCLLNTNNFYYFLDHQVLSGPAKHSGTSTDAPEISHVEATVNVPTVPTSDSKSPAEKGRCGFSIAALVGEDKERSTPTKDVTVKPSSREGVPEEPSASEVVTAKPSTSEGVSEEPLASEGVSEEPLTCENVTEKQLCSEVVTAKPSSSECPTVKLTTSEDKTICTKDSIRKVTSSDFRTETLKATKLPIEKLSLKKTSNDSAQEDANIIPSTQSPKPPSEPLSADTGLCYFYFCILLVMTVAHISNIVCIIT